jgi:tRNA (mo5U34)-methyltransferase
LYGGAVVQGLGSLGERVAAIEEWYHTLDLGQGVVTPGWFDTRSVVPSLPMPSDLDGRRCLDVGTFDGFWAFEMERRGGEVTAIDVLDPLQWDWPAGSDPEVVAEVGRRKAGGSGFEVARDALGSEVRRIERSVYEIDEAELGRFDFVYVGSLLLHLRDPIRALERVRAVCDGQVLVVDAIDLELSLVHPRRPVAGLDGVGRPWWWKPNLAGLAHMLEVAGLRVIGRARRLYMPPGPGQQVGRARLGMLRSRSSREAAITSLRGDPHAAVLAAPAP